MEYQSKSFTHERFIIRPSYDHLASGMRVCQKLESLGNGAACSQSRHILYLNVG